MFFTCTNCDAQHQKWEGRCRECGKWGTLKEETRNSKLEIRNKSAVSVSAKPAAVSSFNTLDSGTLKRIALDSFPTSSVFEKGIVLGSVTLLSGEPGAGKSTLSLQLAQSFSTEVPVLYCTAEESAVQLKERGDRLGVFGPHLSVVESTKLEELLATIVHTKPKIVILDSLQTITSEESGAELGSLSQIKIATAALSQYVRAEGIALIIIGHVTKDGALAGPKLLEHLVDAVYYLEADRASSYRILRCFKNRYGRAGTAVVMKIGSTGLKEVKDASTIFIHNFSQKPGSVLTIAAVDDRYFFLEVQALVSKTSFGYAKRTASGFSRQRLEVLLAVMKKALLLDFDEYDVYVNIAGGFSVHEPALDLAVILATISSIKDVSIPEKTVVFGEVGLSGELRVVKDTGTRLQEIGAHDFTSAILPPLEGKIAGKLKLHSASTLSEVIKALKW